MKKLLVFLLLGLFFISFASAVVSFNSHGVTFTTDETGLGAFNYGMVFTPKYNVTVINATQTAVSPNPATDSCKLYHYPNLTLIGSYSWSGLTCNIGANVTEGKGYVLTAYSLSWRGYRTGASGGRLPSSFAQIFYNQTSWLDNRTDIYVVWDNIVTQNYTTIPIVTLNSPANNSVYLSTKPVTFNWTTSGGTLINSSIFINGVRNETLTLYGSSLTNTTSKYFAPGVYNWYVQSCDTGNSCGYSENRTINVSRILLNSNSYTTPISEGIPTTIIGNISTNNTNISTAYLNYSGTLYQATVSGSSGEFLLTRTITTPLVTGSSNKSFNWLITLDDSDTFNSSFMGQVVSDILLGNCTTYNVTLYNFTMVDETSQSKLNETSLNTLGLVDFDIYLADGTTLLQSYSTSFNKTNPFAICLSNAITTGSFIVDGQVQYSADGYVSEFYNIQSENITASDLNTNITLYDLNSSIAQEFLITYTDRNFQPVSDALILVNRKYISEGIFKTVEIPITDSKGQALVNLVLSDVIYTFNVMKDGVLLGTFENVVAFCDNVATGDCTINLNSYSTTTAPDTFANVGGYAFSITYDRPTRTASVSFGVSSGSTATNLLNVTLDDGYGYTQLCTDTLVSASGTLSCSIGSTYENSTIYLSLIKDSELIARAKITQFDTPDQIYGASRVFIAIVGFLLLISIGLTESPMIMIILLGVGSIMLVSFNLIAGATGVGQTATVLGSIIFFIVGLVLILIKGARR